MRNYTAECYQIFNYILLITRIIPVQSLFNRQTMRDSYRIVRILNGAVLDFYIYYCIHCVVRELQFTRPPTQAAGNNNSMHLFSFCLISTNVL